MKWEDSGDDATWEDEELVRKENPQLIKDFNESLRTGVKRSHGKEMKKNRKRKHEEDEDEDGKEEESHRSKKKKKNKKGKKDEENKKKKKKKNKKDKDRNKEVIDNLSEGSSIVSGESTMEAALSLTFLANVLIGEEEKGDNSNSSMTHLDDNDNNNNNHNNHNTHNNDDDNEDEEMEQREDAGRNLSAFFGSLQPAQTRPTAAGFSSLAGNSMAGFGSLAGFGNLIDGSAWPKRH